jgi:hypothetical protein
MAEGRDMKIMRDQEWIRKRKVHPISGEVGWGTHTVKMF